MLMRAVATAVTFASASAGCEPWCNSWTCSQTTKHAPCHGCAVCLSVASGEACESWCNPHTCGDKFRCGGCATCGERPDAEQQQKGQPPVKQPAPPKQVAKAGPPGWGCCADRQATSCDSCRYWTAGGFCALHDVNCGTCGFSLFCGDPLTTPPPAPPAPPPTAPIDLQCRRGRLYDCSAGVAPDADGGGCASSEFVFKGVSWYGMEERYALTTTDEA